MAKSHHNKPRDEAGNRDRLAANSIAAWRRTLANEPETAKAAIARAMDHLSRSRRHHPFDLNRFESQMRNGVMTPGDFLHDAQEQGG